MSQQQQQPTSIALVATAILFLVLGAGAGAVWMKKLSANEDDADKTEKVKKDSADKAGKDDKDDSGGEAAPVNPRPMPVNLPGGAVPGPRPGGPPTLGPPGGPGGPGGMGGGMGGMRPSPKAQLATLIAKLDVLTNKPLKIDLTSEQRAKMTAQLKGLADEADLSDDDAKKRLDAVLEIVKTDKETLEAAGYRWPGSGGGGGAGGRPGAGTPPKNPFKDEANGKHLKALQDLLVKPATN